MHMNKFASKKGSLLIKTSNGYRFKMSKKEWSDLGRKAGWLKSSSRIIKTESCDDVSADIWKMPDSYFVKVRMGQSGYSSYPNLTYQQAVRLAQDKVKNKISRKG